MLMDRTSIKIMIVLLTCINVIIYAGILLYIGAESGGRKQSNKNASIDTCVVQDGEAVSGTDDDTDNYEEYILSEPISKEDYASLFNRSGTERLTAIFEGNSFYVNNTITFNFGYGNLFSGFFDSSNVSVHGFSYEIAFLDEQMVLNIYNSDRTAVVMYYVYLDSNDDISLYYKDADITMGLRKV